jgi:hypothetical protein
MPLGVVTEHGVEGYNHLAHHGDDDDFGLFASGDEGDRRMTPSRHAAGLSTGFERRVFPRTGSPSLLGVLLQVRNHRFTENLTSLAAIVVLR